MTRHKLTILGWLSALSILFAGGAVAQQNTTSTQENTDSTQQSGSGQEEATVNLGSTIIGNQEQPKVLYIVPWKAVNAAEVENQTIESQLDIVFGHVEPVELRRELNYRKELSNAGEQSED